MCSASNNPALQAHLDTILADLAEAKLVSNMLEVLWSAKDQKKSPLSQSIVERALFADLVLSLCRLWDKEQDTHSIVQLSSTANWEKGHQFRNEINAILHREIVKSLKSIRNGFIAHSSKEPKQIGKDGLHGTSDLIDDSIALVLKVYQRELGVERQEVDLAEELSEWADFVSGHPSA